MVPVDEIREQLNARLERLRGRVSAIRRDRRQEDGPLDADWEEQAVDLENAEVLDHLDVEGRDEIGQIHAALTRLDAGTYGRCESCGKTIPAGRLKALPFATRCISCAA